MNGAVFNFIYAFFRSISSFKVLELAREIQRLSVSNLLGPLGRGRGHCLPSNTTKQHPFGFKFYLGNTCSLVSCLDRLAFLEGVSGR